jgi:oligopeptide/dipeptide ABC transporter ATP-binding protein
MSPSGERNTVLAIDDLQVHFHTPAGVVRAVDGVSFSIRQGETVGVVGESGCGKSITALSVMQLVSKSASRRISGNIWFRDRDLLLLDEDAMRRIRGREIAMIFQDPMSSLNPVLTIGEQLSEVLICHKGMRAREARDFAINLLEQVRIADPRRRLDAYPFELSGGMRQRVMIAIALSCEPALLLADEPTTALDVTVQAQILELLRESKVRAGTSIVLVTHDLGVIAEAADRVVVMYAGRVVEEADVRQLFDDARHPYTKGLMRSVARDGAARHGDRLHEIPGSVPAFGNTAEGCAFRDRCSQAVAICRRERPSLASVGQGHKVACWVAQDGGRA